MNRVRSLLAVVVPSLFVVGLGFTRFGHAAGGNDSLLGYWPASADDSNSASRKSPTPPDPPDRWGPPVPPVPAVPTVPAHGGRGAKVSASIHGNQIQINGLDEMVAEHLEAVREMLRTNPHIPQDVRDRITARMDRVKAIVHKRLKNFKSVDIDQFEAEIENMEEELARSLDGLDRDLAKVGDQLAKDITKQVSKGVFKDFAKNFDLHSVHRNTRDDSDSGDDPHADDGDNHDADADGGNVEPNDGDDEPRAIDGLKGMTLKPEQRDAIARLKAESRARVAVVNKQLEDASLRLETALADPKTSDAEVVRLVDQVSGHEAAIRKARLLAWVQARRVLDPDQVKKIERAAQANPK